MASKSIFGNKVCVVQADVPIESGRNVHIYIPRLEGWLDGSAIINLDMTYGEKYASIPCFNDKNHIYAFGHDAQQSKGTIILTTHIDEPEGAKDSFKAAMRAYGSVRLSKGEELRVVVSGDVYRGRVVGSRTGTMKTETNLQSVSYTFVITSPIKS